MKTIKNVSRVYNNEDFEQFKINANNCNNLIEKINKEFAEVEVKIIMRLLQQILKREPTLEDKKDVIIYQQENNTSKHYITYKNLKLGIIYRSTDFEKGKNTVKFIPFQIKDYLEPATNLDGTKVTF